MSEVELNLEVGYRLRHHVYGVLELTASEEEQRQYEANLNAAKAPGIVPNEVICQWEDSYFPDYDLFGPPIFSDAELKAAAAYHEVWNSVCSRLPSDLGSEVEEVVALPVWKELMAAAAEAFAVFRIRGSFVELAYPDQFPAK